MISKYLGDKPFWRSALRIAVPIAIQNLLISSFTLVDTMMVGMLGDVALSAVGMAGQWSWLMNMVMFGIASGTAVFVAQYWGIQDIKGIHRTMGIALISAVCMAILFWSAGFFAPRMVISIFNRTPEIIDSGSAYLKIASFSYFAIVLNSVMSSVLRSSEKVILPMAVSGVTTVLNGVLDYCLIFGKLGMPELGISGAAIATCISAWAGPVIILTVSVIQRNIIIAPVRDIFNLSRDFVINFYKKAAPVMINEGLWGLGTLCYNIVFANLGYEHYAAVTILKTFENLSFVFFTGMCDASSVIIGKKVGGGEIRQAIADSLRFVVVIPLIGVVVGAALIIFRPELIGIYNIKDNITDQTIRSAMGIMLMYGLQLPVRNIQYILIVGIFRSGGDTVTGAKYDIMCIWFFALPLTVLAGLVLKLPFIAVFAISYAAEDYIKLIFCVRHYRSLKWIKPVTQRGRDGFENYKKECLVNE